jgi:hypothetical protein
MKPSTTEWVAKAEDDFAVMERECQVGVHPSYDAVCFHAQQCAEKYLKARLCEAGVAFGKITIWLRCSIRFSNRSLGGRSFAKIWRICLILP